MCNVPDHCSSFSFYFIGYTFDITHIEDLIIEDLGGNDIVDVNSNSNEIGQYNGYSGDDIHDIEIIVSETSPGTLKNIDVNSIITASINKELKDQDSDLRI